MKLQSVIKFLDQSLRLLSRSETRFLLYYLRLCIVWYDPGTILYFRISCSFNFRTCFLIFESTDTSWNTRCPTHQKSCYWQGVFYCLRPVHCRCDDVPLWLFSTRDVENQDPTKCKRAVEILLSLDIFKNDSTSSRYVNVGRSSLCQANSFNDDFISVLSIVTSRQRWIKATPSQTIAVVEISDASFRVSIRSTVNETTSWSSEEMIDLMENESVTLSSTVLGKDAGRKHADLDEGRSSPLESRWSRRVHVLTCSNVMSR